MNLYRYAHDIDFVLRRYHISKSSLMHWNGKYDGTRESLVDKSHRPHSQHPNAYTEEELKWIQDYHRRTPDISVCELYGKLLQEKGYSRRPGSLYRVFVWLSYRKKVESTKKKSKHMGHYDTPTELGKKWQMDVKYVAMACYVGKDGKKLHIIHKTIRPRTPWHNGKVERSQERSGAVLQLLEILSYEDLQIQMKRYLRRSNRIPVSVLGWRTPIQKRQALEAARLC